MAPLWRLERRADASGWRSGTRTTRGGVRRVRGAIVAGEIAVATVLLAAAGLVGRSMVGLLAVDPGFDGRHLLSVEYALSGARYDSARAIYAFHRRAVDAIAALPGVVAVGTTNQLPLGGNQDAYGIVAEGVALENPELAPYGDRYVVSPGFLQAMGIRLRRGRIFTDADQRDGGEQVAMLSESLARRLWGTDVVVGRRIRIGGDEGPWHAIVGVVGDVRHGGLDDPTGQQVYVPLGRWRDADSEVTLTVRTTGDPAALAPAVRRTLAMLDPMAPLGRVATMDQVVATSTAQRRLALQLLAAFAGVALLLTVAGLYALLAGAVAERTRELGVRVALGATPRALLALVLGDGARLTIAGLALGLAGAAFATRALRSLLFGVAPGDPATLAGIALLLAAVALLACLAPARRALRIAPTEALRGE
jgi:putative ABC transport system permease protein